MPTEGKIEVIIGPMFSGKTTALIEKLEAVKEYHAFKPVIDNRYSAHDIVTHTGQSIQAIPINSLAQFSEIPLKRHLGFDEVQFFKEDFVQKIISLVESGHHVILAGLDKTFENKPFGIMPLLIDMADNVIWLKAKCFVCQSEAEYTYRKPNLDNSSYIGGSESYEARCYNCYTNHNIKE